MIVQLTLIFTLPVHLGHLLQRCEHGLHYSVVRGVDDLPHLQRVRADKLCLDTADIRGEILDERRDTVTFLARKLGVLD